MVLAAVAIATAACGWAPQSPGWTQREVERDGVRVWVHEAPAGADELGMAALLHASVAVRNGCVGVIADDGVWHPLVWPAGTTLVTGDPVVLRTTTGDVHAGDTVSGGGGEVSLRNVTVDIPEECRAADSKVYMFNPSETVEIVDEGR